jgi:hypothetical protein
MYEFIYFLQKLRAHASRKRVPQARSASAQRELQVRSASREGKAQAHLLPQLDLCRSDPIHL